MLTAIRKALDLVREVAAEKPGYAPPKLLAESRLRLAEDPSKDEKVYEALCNADTVGVFQIESRAQMAMFPRLRPREFYDSSSRSRSFPGPDPRRNGAPVFATPLRRRGDAIRLTRSWTPS